MKILCWAEAFWPLIGGVELFCLALMKDLHKKGHQLKVMTTHRNLPLADHDTYHGVPVVRLPLYEAMLAKDLTRIMQLRALMENEISAFSPDLIHLNLTGAGAFLFLGKTAGRFPMVVSLHGELATLRSGGEDTALGRILTNAKWVTACSRGVLDEATSLVPQIKTKSSVIYMGVEKKDAVPSPLSFAPPRLAFLGRLVAEKGVDRAIDLLASLHPQHPTLELVIGGDGPERQALEKQVQRLGLQHHVSFVGWIEPSAVPDFFNRATIVLMPSRSEGLGIAALEAAWMQRPVVSTRTGGLGEAVLDGITGFTVPMSDPDQLAIKVQHLLENPSVATAMGAAGRLRVESQFKWDRCLNDFETLFTTISMER